MDYENITDERHLIDFCDEISSASAIAFDTEFVSEDTYRPDLCLIQVAASGRLAIIDPHAIGNVTPFWELLTSSQHETIVHAGREEFRFCLHATGKRPNDLFDIQIAAALVGLEYPAAYNTLVQRLLDESLPKGETRTDWRRRPLSDRQLTYAAQDVVHLEPLRNKIVEKLDRLNRREWLATEMSAWQQQVEHAESDERWRRVSGISGLRPRALAIVRELWLWRNEEAERRNRPVKRILRDDLVVELAKRQTADLRRIRAVRGMERRDLKKQHEPIAECIERALALDDAECPKSMSRRSTPQLNLLSQFLSTALNSICREAQVATSIVGTAQDMRELIAFQLGLVDHDNAEPPVLARGWRAEVVGERIEQLLRGKLSIRIADPLSDDPLRFEATDD